MFFQLAIFKDCTDSIRPVDNILIIYLSLLLFPAFIILKIVEIDDKKYGNEEEILSNL